MKKKILYMMALAVGLASCSSDDIFGGFGESLSQGDIKFQLADGSKVSSKATTTDFKTSFEVGDQAGVFVVKDGEVIKENVKITYNSEGYWMPFESFDYETYGDATFYTYYPYSDNATFDITQANPFQPYIDAFKPWQDQSTDEGYEQSDLMTSGATTVSTSSKSVSVKLSHKMAMACIELPNRSYTFTNEDINTYILAKASDAVFMKDDAEIVPFVDDDTQQYRYLVNPQSLGDITISYIYNHISKKVTYSWPDDMSAGDYHVEKYEGGVNSALWTLQVGDFYMNDGTLLAKGTSLTAEQKANVLGVVYKIGTSDPLVTANSRWDHAMVVGLTRSQNTWAPAIDASDPTTTALTTDQNNAGWKSWYTNFGLNHLISNNASASKIVIDELEENGYKNTTNWASVPDIISSANAPKITDDSKKNFAKVFKDVYQAQQEAAPVPTALCTSWYVPSLAAWMDMQNSDLTAIEASISAAGGTALGIASKLSVPYWSSNLRGHETIWGFTADGTTADKLFTSLDMRKDSRYYRWILAF